MPRIPIFWKLFGAFGLLIGVTMATVWFVVSPRVSTHAVRVVRENLAAQASLVLSDLPPGTFVERPPPEVNPWIGRLGRASGARFTLIREDGVVLADSQMAPAAMENHRNRPEIEEARATGNPASSQRPSRTVGDDLLYLAVPVKRDGSIVGYVRASVPLTYVRVQRQNLRENVLIGAAIAVAVSLLIGLLLTRRLTRPLAEMKDAATAIAAGEYGRRLHVTSRDELGQLAGAIQEMGGQLSDRLERLTREGNQLRAILGSMLEGVVAVDRDERIVHLNNVAAQILGTDRRKSLGQRLWEVARIEAVGDTLSEVLTDANERRREIRVPRERGTQVLQLIASPLKDGEDRVAGAVIVLHDVTELRRLEIVRRDFVVNVSHELKTPLTAIRGFVETLIDDPEIDAETRERFLRRVKDQVLRLSTLVSDLLVLSRVESEEEALERRPVDIRGPVRESARRFSPDATGRDMDFVTDLPDLPVVVLGDEEALRQVVDNLLDNAFKYTPDEGIVRVRVAVEGTDAVIEVGDTGIGIEPKDIDRIFERFYRVDKARSRELGGTGLGLSIVKHIANALGGRVSVKSAGGRGSTFRVTIPRYEPA
jgi:two-component system phosphate regulon sensor histidine kinase PhoR